MSLGGSQGLMADFFFYLAIIAVVWSGTLVLAYWLGRRSSQVQQ